MSKLKLNGLYFYLTIEGLNLYQNSRLIKQKHLERFIQILAIKTKTELRELRKQLSMMLRLLNTLSKKRLKPIRISISIKNIFIFVVHQKISIMCPMR